MTDKANGTACETVEVSTYGRWTRLPGGGWGVRIKPYDPEAGRFTAYGDTEDDRCDEEAYAGPRGAGVPVCVISEDGRHSIRYINEVVDRLTYTVVDSPGDATCIRRGRHTPTSSSCVLDWAEMIQSFGLDCTTCDASISTGTQSPIDDAEKSREFEDWDTNPHYGESKDECIPDARMWGLGG
ncbi:MAG: hypothetical protein J4F28_02200 [Nitrosopumilaceae archaeon]|nr:hypothetical protein [Nitrosopumilaceae archaeon]